MLSYSKIYDKPELRVMSSMSSIHQWLPRLPPFFEACRTPVCGSSLHPHSHPQLVAQGSQQYMTFPFSKALSPKTQPHSGHTRSGISTSSLLILWIRVTYLVEVYRSICGKTIRGEWKINGRLKQQIEGGSYLQKSANEATCEFLVKFMRRAVFKIGPRYSL